MNVAVSECIMFLGNFLRDGRDLDEFRVRMLSLIDGYILSSPPEAVPIMVSLLQALKHYHANEDFRQLLATQFPGHYMNEAEIRGVMKDACERLSAIQSD
jgi:hypothetical protein